MRALLSLLVLVVCGCSGPGTTTLTFVSVGQGDSTILLSRGATLAFDVGTDVAGRVVARAVFASGARAVDGVVLTHPDADHIGGLPALCCRMRVGAIFVPAAFREHRELIDTLRRARRTPNDVTWIDAPTVLRLGEATVELRPPPYALGDAANEGSFFAIVEAEGARAVLTGDASIAAEEAMVRAGDWRAQVLKAGHHGSASSTGSALLRAVAPRYVIVSCGRGNEFGHPRDVVLERSEGAGARILRTDRAGDIVFERSGGEFVLARTQLAAE